jgi:hypothetical protein
MEHKDLCLVSLCSVSLSLVLLITLSIVMLNAIMLIVSILSVVLMNAFRLSVVTLNEDPLMPLRPVCQTLKSDLSRTSNRDQIITMAFRNLITLC